MKLQDCRVSRPSRPDKQGRVNDRILTLLPSLRWRSMVSESALLAVWVSGGCSSE